MRYLYTIYKNNLDGTSCRRDTTTRAANLATADVTYPYYVVVDDMLLAKNNISNLTNLDELEEWKENIARAYQWADAQDKAKLEVPFFANKPVSYEEMKERMKEATKFVETAEAKSVNLKTIASSNKPKTSPVPPIAIFALGAAMQDGANKYGRFNWRTSEVTASVFFDAMMRHLLMWYSGEDKASDSKVHHLAHLMAGAAILLDAIQTGVLIDDRDLDKENSDFERMNQIIKG